MTRAKKRSSSGGMMTVKVGRFGEQTSEFKICKGDCVSTLLEKIGIGANSSQTICVNGVRVYPETILKAGDLVQIIGRKEGGNDEPKEEVAEDVAEDTVEDTEEEDEA
jgi:hypothetical protein